MIDITTYRERVGQYCPGKRKSESKLGKFNKRCQGRVFWSNNSIFYEGEFNCIELILLFYILFLLYIVLFVISLVIGCAASNDFRLVGVHSSLPFYINFVSDLPFLSTVCIKIWYITIISFAIRKIYASSRTRKCSPASIFFGSKTSRVRQLVSCMLVALFILNFLLIAIVNPSLLNPGPQILSVYYQNVQGLIPFSNLDDAHPKLNRSKIYELNTYIHTKKPAVVLLSETWLKKSIKDREVIENPNYTVYRNDRSRLSHPADPGNPKKYRKNGGGVLIAIRSDINATSKRFSLSSGAEMVAIEVVLNSCKYIFCCCYRVGTLGAENHQKIVNSFDRFFKCKRPKKIFIVGDFNLNGIHWPIEDDYVIRDPTELSFVDSFKELGLTQCITMPTHIKGKTLDLVLTNYAPLIDNLSVSGTDSICKSDHFPITFDVKVNVKINKPMKRTVYNFKKASWDALNHDLCHTQWDAMLGTVEPEVAWRRFKSTLFLNVDKYIPKISIKCEVQPPWFDSEVHEAYRSKVRAHKQFRTTKSKKDELNFLSARGKFKNLSNQKMRDNLYCTDDPALITKKFWSHVKFNSESRRLPEAMYFKDCHRNNPSDIANLYNNFFFEQFSERSTYNTSPDWTSDIEIDFCHRKIRRLLSNINSNKSCGPDGIHGKVLKMCAVSLAYPLSIIYRLSYNTGNIPKDWKLANIVPVHKKGSKENIENYRPISLTSLVMKTFERLLKDEILIHTSDMLDSRQHGFLAKKSCTTNMAEFSDSLALSLNNSSRTDVVYFDFSKAFDSVSHDLILWKLKYIYKIDGRMLKFLSSWLSDREQCVVIGNEKSSYKPVLSGVPQGSILGPILFVLFINDMCTGLSPGTNLALYADDTKIWRVINSEADHNILQNDIAYLNDWAKRNRMNFHPQKCKVVSVSHREPPLLGILPFIQYYYSLGECLLDYADNEKDLGVIINKKLNFNDHCTQLLSKAKQIFGLTRRTCDFVNDVKRKRVLFLSLIRSQFEHCSPVWRPINKSMIDRFENFQKRCIKWILSEENISYGAANVYLNKCRQVNILPLEKRFDLNDLLFFHKVVYNLLPHKLPDYLSFFDGTSRLRSSHLDSLSIVSSLQPKHLSDVSLNKSCFYRTHSLWNSLPFDIRNIQGPSSFKIEVIKYLWKLLLMDDNVDFECDFSFSDMD